VSPAAASASASAGRLARPKSNARAREPILAQSIWSFMRPARACIMPRAGRPRRLGGAQRRHRGNLYKFLWAPRFFINVTIAFAPARGPVRFAFARPESGRARESQTRLTIISHVILALANLHDAIKVFACQSMPMRRRRMGRPVGGEMLNRPAGRTARGGRPPSQRARRAASRASVQTKSYPISRTRPRRRLTTGRPARPARHYRSGGALQRPGPAESRPERQ
jgi:hypothetical protein